VEHASCVFSPHLPLGGHFPRDPFFNSSHQAFDVSFPKFLPPVWTFSGWSPPPSFPLAPPILVGIQFPLSFPLLWSFRCVPTPSPPGGSFFLTFLSRYIFFILFFCDESPSFPSWFFLSAVPGFPLAGFLSRCCQCFCFLPVR